MNNINIDEMYRGELMELRDRVAEKLKTFRPYRIKERWTVCGRLDCWCNAEAALGHGPYLYASFREDGQTKKLSLGLKRSEQEMLNRRPGLPHLDDFLDIPDYKYRTMTHAATEGWIHTTLTVERFEERFGVTTGQDNFGFARKYWGPPEAFDKYQIEYNLVLQHQQIPHNPWVGYGVSTLEAIAKLEWLEARGYYQKY